MINDLSLPLDCELSWTGVDWTSYSEDEQENYALMAYSNSGSDTEREQLGDASIEIQAYTQALKKVEAQLVAHQQNQLWYEEKIRFMKIDLDDKTDVLTYHKKLLAEAEKEKEELKAKVEKWHNSSKNLNILLTSQMSARDKAGLGYGNQMNKGVLSYENEVFESVFYSRSSDIEDSPVNDRYAEGMHAVPPPMTGIYIPSGPDVEIDESQFTYGPKQSKPSESDARSSDFNSCESNSSEETLTSMPEPVVNEPKVVSQPKVWSDAPIIEEYESDSDDEHVSLPTKEQETPSFAFVNTVKHVKTPRQTVKEQNTCSQNPKPDKKDCSGLMSKKLGLGYGFTKKACFVCGSFSHLIRDCDFHEKRMAKQAELNKRMCKGTGKRENKPVWNNVQRVNHQNQFVPKAVLTRTGRISVNTARASSTNNVNTARHNFNSQAAPTNAARKVNTVKPIVNNLRPKTIFHKTQSPIRRPFYRTTAPRTKFSNQKVNTAEVKAVSAVGGKRKTVVKPSAGCNWRIKRHYWNKVSKYNGGSNSRKCDVPHKALENKGIVDSGCSRHMTGNKAYLAEYQDYNGGPVAFGVFCEQKNLDDGDVFHRVIWVPESNWKELSMFWMSAKSKTINNVRYITAIVAGKHVTISEASIRSDLLFDDVDGIDTMNNQAIFDTIHLIGSKSTSWDQIPTNIATALKNVPVPLDHFPINTLISKVLSFMVKKGKNFSRNVTPLFDFMLVQPTEDEGEASERPSESQPIPSPSHPSEDQHESQPGPSPRPSPSIPIPNSNPEGSGGNHGGQSSSDKSLSGNEDGLTLQSVYDLCVSLCKQTGDAHNEKGVSMEDQVSTVNPDEGTDKPKVSTDQLNVSTDKLDEGTAEPKNGNSYENATPTATPTIFGDDETIVEFLVSMSQNKAKQKGVEIKDDEDSDRPRPTSTRLMLTLKPLPKIDPKDKGKKVLEEEAELEAKSEGVNEAERKFAQLSNDEEIARKVKEEWETEKEKKKLAEAEATKAALIRDYDDIQAKIEADSILAARLQEEEREKFTIEERAKLLHDTIFAQRRFLAQ
ncbi:hypothetical protein Tco_1492391 [Tanacetum coccineum]